MAMSSEAHPTQELLLREICAGAMVVCHLTKQRDNTSTRIGLFFYRHKLTWTPVVISLLVVVY
jgi:hypothetical protein